jgi:molecular chaperone GrpE
VTKDNDEKKDKKSSQHDDKKTEKKTESVQVDKSELKKYLREAAELKKENEKMKASESELNDKVLRITAEYDNFRKRSQKEKDSIYADAKADALKELIPIFDNLQRASEFSESEKVTEGVRMILSKVPEVLNNLGIETFGKPGDKFDPCMHNAIMHVDDDKYGSEEIVEVLQCGYKIGDKIIRYAMVKVAN